MIYYDHMHSIKMTVYCQSISVDRLQTFPPDIVRLVLALLPAPQASQRHCQLIASTLPAHCKHIASTLSKRPAAVNDTVHRMPLVTVDGVIEWSSFAVNYRLFIVVHECSQICNLKIHKKNTEMLFMKHICHRTLTIVS